MAPEYALSESGGWIVVVGRNPAGEPISASGILGGVTDVTCNTTPIRKLLLNIPLDAAYAGAGVFDISGGLLGIVGRCGDAWHAISHPSIMELLDQQSGAHAVAWRDFGVRVATPDELETKLLGLRGGGLFVSEVRKQSPAAAIGIRPGDLLTSSGDFPLRQPEDLASLNDSLTLIRQGRKLVLASHPAFSVDQPATSAILSSVRPDSRLHVAGLRAGDRIVRLGDMENPSPADIARIVASKHPSYLIYERANRRVGAVLR
jgi:membrane-associated protease RseP (regulator of RpoE activity)